MGDSLFAFLKDVDAIKKTVTTEYSDGKVVTEITEWPKKANTDARYYQHSNGHQRSIKNRWDIALQVNCTRCSATKGVYCINLHTSETTTYPHNPRFKEALLQKNARFKESVLQKQEILPRFIPNL